MHVCEIAATMHYSILRLTMDSGTAYIPSVGAGEDDLAGCFAPG